MLILQNNDSCPCGSKQTYEACCALIHQGQAALTAESLMRSRYSAFVKGLVPYLLASWCPNSRPKQLDLRDQPLWTKLIIHAKQQGEMFDQIGLVEFSAFYQTDEGEGVLHETSQFQRNAEGQWCYLTGKVR